MMRDHQRGAIQKLQCQLTDGQLQIRLPIGAGKAPALSEIDKMVARENARSIREQLARRTS